MSYTQDNKPTEWFHSDGLVDAGHDMYYWIEPHEGPLLGKHVWAFHWHTPDVCRHCGKRSEPDGDHNCPCPHADGGKCQKSHMSFDRWMITTCGNHTVVQEEPLTLTASLACESGCPWHGHLTNGEWVPV